MYANFSLILWLLFTLFWIVVPFVPILRKTIVDSEVFKGTIYQEFLECMIGEESLTDELEPREILFVISAFSIMWVGINLVIAFLHPITIPLLIVLFFLIKNKQKK